MDLIRLDERHYFKASDIIREFGAKFGIKTLDVLQLAAAHGLDNTRFLCSDKLLSKLAVEMGMRLL